MTEDNDVKNIALLLCLYMLQGLPYGLVQGSLPFLLNTYTSCNLTSIGYLSFAGYSYSLKFLWSPFVDEIYSRRFGRRKSWVVQCTMISGMTVFWISTVIDRYTGLIEDLQDASSCHAPSIAAGFFCLIFVLASQDIAVDAWSIFLISKRNIEWASTSQTIGMGIGNFISFPFLLLLLSPDICRKYICLSVPNNPREGLVLLSSFLKFWSFIYFLLAIFVAVFVSEGGRNARTRKLESIIDRDLSSTHPGHTCDKDLEPSKIQKGPEKVTSRGDTLILLHTYLKSDSDGKKRKSTWKRISDTYNQIVQLSRLESIRNLCLIMVLCRIGFIPVDTVARLQFVDKGVKHEYMALLVLLQFPMEIGVSLVTTLFISRSRKSGVGPMTTWMKGYKLSLFVSGLVPVVLAYFPSAQKDGLVQKNTPWRLLAAVSAILSASSLANKAMFIALGSQFNSITDTRIGGTYVSFLYAFSNFGWSWPRFFVFFLTDHIGFEITSLVCVLAGLLLVRVFSKSISRIEAMPVAAWRI